MRKFVPLCFGAAWLITISTGLAFLAEYENTPGPRIEAPLRWPISTAVTFSQKHPTLVMFAHPRCPCTRSSINELSMLMADCQNRVDATVLFFQPSSSNANWSRTDLWRSAAAIPGVTARADIDGQEAKLFHATTSGNVILFNAAGEMVFNGGITGSRGHEGDNDGRAALTSLLLYDKTIGAETPVFGCSLTDPGRACPATP